MQNKMNEKMKSTDQNYALRVCTQKDIKSVMEINEKSLPENYPLFFYEQILERYPESFVLAYLKNKPKIIIGYIMWRIEKGPSSFSLDYIKKGHLVSLAILENYRRIGIGDALMKESMRLILQHSISEYVLEVRVSNIAAIHLYMNLNDYERIRIIGHYYRDGEDAFYMAYSCKSSNGYIQGSTGMTDDEIIQYYVQKNQSYICFKCKKCNYLILKGLSYSFPGSISPNDDSTYICSSCGTILKIYDISQGKYDIQY